MKPITIGMIGAGRIGKMHAHNIAAHFPHVRIKAICSPHVDETWAQTLSIPVIAQDNRAIWEDSEIQAVVISAPSAFHVDLIKQAAATQKDIFCEKPIAFTEEAIQEAVDAVNQAGVSLFVGFNRRFDTSFMQIQQGVSRGDIGQVQLVKISNRDPKLPPEGFIGNSGGLFMDFTVHDFDMARYVTGSEVAEISVMAAAFDARMAQANDLDTALVNLRMQNGALVSIDNSREAQYGYDQRLEVFGSKGSLLANNLTPTNVVWSTAKGIVSQKPLYSFVERYKDSYLVELQSFFESLTDSKPMAVSGEDALKAVQVAIAAERAWKENTTISL